MDKLLFKDNLFLDDNSIKCGFRGEFIVGKNKRIVEYIDPYGNKSYRTKFGEILFKQKNIVVIGGYDWLFSKMFNLTMGEHSTLRVGDLNFEAPQMKIGVPRDRYMSPYYNTEISGSNPSLQRYDGVNISARDYIFGFMIGDGGSREDNITAIATDYKRRQLFHAIPFRMSNDSTNISKDKYFGKYVDMNNTSSYYIKKFDDPSPHIVHVWVTDNKDELEIVDDSVYSSTSSIPIESYVEMNISIDKDDARGYFNSTNSTIRINELGLVSGWYNQAENDLESIHLVTHLTRKSILPENDDTIDALYRLYAR